MKEKEKIRGRIGGIIILKKEEMSKRCSKKKKRNSTTFHNFKISNKEQIRQESEILVIQK